MHRRARYLIRTLVLRPHPEGGHFTEVFRSPHRVRRADSGLGG
ncbi:MAG: cupin domain-containing protein, partial [Gemmatimonadales bacterium]